MESFKDIFEEESLFLVGSMDLDIGGYSLSEGSREPIFC